MTILTGKNLAVTLIAGLLILASVENHASDIDSYLDNAMRTQVFEELKENVQRLYEDAVIVPAGGLQDNNVHTGSLGFPVAVRYATEMRPYRVGVVN